MKKTTPFSRTGSGVGPTLKSFTSFTCFRSGVGFSSFFSFFLHIFFLGGSCRVSAAESFAETCPHSGRNTCRAWFKPVGSFVSFAKGSATPHSRHTRVRVAAMATATEIAEIVPKLRELEVGQQLQAALAEMKHPFARVVVAQGSSSAGHHGHTRLNFRDATLQRTTAGRARPLRSSASISSRT